MNLESLKSDILQKLFECKDENTLQEILRLLSTYEIYSDKVKEEETIYKSETTDFTLNHAQEKAVEEAREEYANGESLSDEEDSEYFSKWLKK